jgi:hypothetical protein
MFSVGGASGRPDDLSVKKVGATEHRGELGVGLLVGALKGVLLDLGHGAGEEVRGGITDFVVVEEGEGHTGGIEKFGGDGTSLGGSGETGLGGLPGVGELVEQHINSPFVGLSELRYAHRGPFRKSNVPH